MFLAVAIDKHSMYKAAKVSRKYNLCIVYWREALARNDLTHIEAMDIHFRSLFKELKPFGCHRFVQSIRLKYLYIDVFFARQLGKTREQLEKAVDILYKLHRNLP